MIKFDDVTKFEKYNDLKWSGILKSIKKSANILQPLFEGFTNSLESIKMRIKRGDDFSPYINIILSYNSSTDGDSLDLSSLTIEDNGIGFDEDNYKRLVVFKDDTKGYNNRGSGRIQMIHAFQLSQYDSIYKEGDILMKRGFVISGTRPFIDKNTIIYKTEEPTALEGDEEIKTILKMYLPTNEHDAKEYAELGADDIKKKLINHYLLTFCNGKDSLPLISIIYKIGGEVKDRDTILVDDIPDPTCTDVLISVPLCKISDDMKRIQEVEDTHIPIKILPYKINADMLQTSEIKITSKGEICDNTKIKLTCIDPDAELDNCRYLFLLSSDYFDDLEGDERGNIEILDKTEFKKVAKAQGYIEHQIVLNDIQDGVNAKASEIYSEILTQNEEFQERLEQLKKDYLLSEDALLEVSLSDSIDDVFKKAYTYDAKVMAKQSAAYEKSVQKLNELNPTTDDYQDQLSSIVDSLVESLPVQNRATLSKYVARRKMVIELMGKILDRLADCQDDDKRNQDEKLLHNLIFKQHSDNPLSSDMWLINEEYMYFTGSSESKLSQLKLDGERIFKDIIDEEEKRYLNSLGEKRADMRTDVLLFPAEGKCVIIEFKNPKVNVADCINQITKYAYFLRNFTKPQFKFITFYGYLIGESVEKRDVRAVDGDFQTAPNLDYLFRPKKTIPDDSGAGVDGTLYMEVLKFSVLRERASLRNKAFIDRLMEDALPENRASGEENECS